MPVIRIDKILCQIFFDTFICQFKILYIHLFYKTNTRMKINTQKQAIKAIANMASIYFSAAEFIIEIMDGKRGTDPMTPVDFIRLANLCVALEDFVRANHLVVGVFARDMVAGPHSEHWQKYTVMPGWPEFAEAYEHYFS